MLPGLGQVDVRRIAFDVADGFVYGRVAFCYDGHALIGGCGGGYLIGGFLGHGFAPVNLLRSKGLWLEEVVSNAHVGNRVSLLLHRLDLMLHNLLSLVFC